MNAVTVGEMRSLERDAMMQGIGEESLMDQAGEQLARSFANFFPHPGTVIAYLGKGHNAGDALVALKFLRDTFGWKIATRAAFPLGSWAPLTRIKSFQLGNVRNFEEPPEPDKLARPIVLLDGLLGIGASGPPRDPIAAMITEMNRLRNGCGAKIAAIDLPSGIDPDSGEVQPGAVTADITFMIGAPKIGLLRENAANATGGLSVVPVPSLLAKQESDWKMISSTSLKAVHQPRPFNFHKGCAGRVGLLVGSRNFSGAAVIAATAALRAGAGLVTIHAPPEATELIASRSPVEAIILPCRDPREILGLKYDSLVIGCGLKSDDPHFNDRVLKLIARTQIPTVIDAEALNLLAASGDLSILRSNHLLTPHPGEFSRLAPDLANQPREASARTFADRHPSTLLLKGCRTLVTAADGPMWFNPTGTPGMSTGGQGDLLSGVIGALLAIGNPLTEAATIAAWLCGRAAESAIQNFSQSPESLLPTDVLQNLGNAFRNWSEKSR